MEESDVHVGPGGGALVDLGGLGVHFKVRGEHPGGSFAIAEHPIEPRILVDPHIQRHEDELSYVLEGTIWARVGDREIEASPGSYVWKPRGVLHTVWNPGPQPARILEVISPVGFERLFEEVAELLERSSEPSERRGVQALRKVWPQLRSLLGGRSGVTVRINADRLNRRARVSPMS